MSMTNTQKTILHNDMLARPELSSMLATGDDIGLANFYNQLAAPDFIVWRPSVRKDEITASPTFDWTRVDNLTVGKARIWDMLFDNASKSIVPSQANIRAGIDAAWVGTAADLAVRASVYAMCKRKATLVEKLLAIGTGTDATPATLGYEGPISYQDISEARVWQ
mgnify:CR=1 FL=1